MKIKIEKNNSLAPLTTFKVGGKAFFYTVAKTASEVTEAIEYAKEEKVPAFILGGGSNVLFADSGFPGMVIHFTGDAIHLEGHKLEVFAGAKLLDVVRAVGEKGLAGIENLAGVPGYIGGAIRGNAGAFGSEIGEYIQSVKAVNLRDGIVKNFSKSDCQFSYRQSFFKHTRDWVIISAEFFFPDRMDPAKLHAIHEHTIAKREAKHPQDAQCAGSFFMNPLVTDQTLLDEFARETGEPSKNGKLPAGWLVTHVGLRGKKVGGAQMSPKHPNYLINTGNATAEDIVMLASLVKTKVRDELGIRLQEEVQMVGF